MPDQKISSPFPVRSLLVLIAVTAVVLATVVLVRGWPNASTEPASTTSAETATLAIGAPAPEFKALDVKGQPISLAALRGKAVWLVFQATWCTICRTELPDVSAASQTESVATIGIYLKEDKKLVADYAERLKVSFPSLPDPAGEIARKYQVTSVPTHVFIDAQGTVKAVRKGALSPSQIKESLTAISN